MSRLGSLVLLLGGAVVSLACGQPTWPRVEKAIAREFPSVPQLPPDELADWLSDPSRPTPLLLDVREAEEYEVSHLAGARRVDPDAPASVLADVDRSTPIVAYCSVGYRSSRFAERLLDAGFAEVWNLEGSIFAWANGGYSVVRDGREVGVVHPYDEAWGRLLDPALRSPL